MKMSWDLKAKMFLYTDLYVSVLKLCFSTEVSSQKPIFSLLCDCGTAL